MINIKNLKLSLLIIFILTPFNSHAGLEGLGDIKLSPLCLPISIVSDSLR